MNLVALLSLLNPNFYSSQVKLYSILIREVIISLFSILLFFFKCMYTFILQVRYFYDHLDFYVEPLLIYRLVFINILHFFFQLNTFVDGLNYHWPDLTRSIDNNQLFWKAEYKKHGSCTFNNQYLYFGLTLTLAESLEGQLSRAFGPGCISFIFT